MWAYDECYFNLWKSSHRIWVNTQTEARLERRPLTNSQEAVSIGIACCISRTRKSKICILPKNWHVDDLVRIWTRELLPSINWDPTFRGCRAFIMDNDGRHRSRNLIKVATENGLNRNGYLPSNSPDLNPIENLWHMMKQRVIKSNPTNYNQLRRAIDDAWESITVHELKNLMDSLPRRMQLVIDCNGNRIKC